MGKWDRTTYRREPLFFVCPNSHIIGVEVYAPIVPTICPLAGCGRELVAYDARRKQGESNTSDTD